MADLLSIAPLTETAEVRGASVTVKGVSVAAIAQLLYRFPDFRKAWATGKWDTDQMLAMSDDMMAAIIAAGVVEIDEANAINLALDEKAELLGAVMRVTMPRGPVPFVQALTKLMGSVGVEASAKAPDTN